MDFRQFFSLKEWLRIVAIFTVTWIVSYVAIGSVGAATTIVAIFLLLGLAGLFYT